MKNFCKYLLSIAVTLSGVQVSAADDGAPKQPTCQKTTTETVYDGGDSGTYTTRTIQNSACMREWDTYHRILAEYNAAKANGQKENFQGAQKPQQPPSKNCAVDDFVCAQEEQREQRAYHRQLEIYEQQEQAAAADKLREKEKLESAARSSTSAYSDMSEKNQKGGMIYQVASMAAGVAGGYFLTKGVGCSSSCPTGCCAAAPGFYVKSAVAFGIMAMAMSQKNRMDKASHSACQSAAQTSASGVSCGAPPPIDVGNPYDPTNPNNPVTQVGPDGKCLPTAPPDCKNTLPQAAGLAGIDIKDAGRGVSAFGSDKNKLKISKDGTVLFPNGKKMPMSELLTKEGMMKAGLSAADADSLMKQMGIGPNTAKQLDAKSELDAMKYDPAADTAIGDAGGGSSSTVSANVTNGAGVGSKDGDKGKRDPAAEGLTKAFNGETIGAAGDDIFSMMNRRYKLKTAQDTFFAPAP